MTTCVHIAIFSEHQHTWSQNASELKLQMHRLAADLILSLGKLQFDRKNFHICSILQQNT